MKKLNYMPQIKVVNIITIKDAMTLLTNTTYKEFNNIELTDKEIAETYGVIFNDMNWFYKHFKDTKYETMFNDLLEKQFGYTNTSMTSIMVREVFSDNYVFYVEKIKGFLGDIKNGNVIKFKGLLKEINQLAFDRYNCISEDAEYYDTVILFKQLENLYIDLVVDNIIDDTLHYRENLSL